MSALLGLAGGAMIGTSASVLLLFAGEILGASGIVSTALLTPRKVFNNTKQHWKYAFIATFLLLDTLLLSRYFDRDFDDSTRTYRLSNLAFGVGGLFVGFGTKLGNGCTSGHGICGLARLSKRSFVAVCTFMAYAILTTTLTYGIKESSTWTGYFTTNESWNDVWMNFSYVLVTILSVASLTLVIHKTRHDELAMKKIPPGVVGGLLFGAGLFVSRMIYRNRVLGFLDMTGLSHDWKGNNGWDYTLICVMGGGLLVSFISYQFIDGHRFFNFVTSKPLEHPVHCDQCIMNVPSSAQQIDTPLVLGAAFFGVGWGLAGICPGPALFLAGAGVAPVIAIWWPAFLVGSFLAIRAKDVFFAPIVSSSATSPIVEETVYGNGTDITESNFNTIEEENTAEDHIDKPATVLSSYQQHGQ